MKRQERLFIALTLFGISFLTIFDLITDLREGVSWWHVLIEAVVAFAGAAGFIYLLAGIFKLKVDLEKQRMLSEKLKQENEIYKAKSKIYLEGLSAMIDDQLTRWGLSNAEKEVAFLLLKGFSLKEVAQVRSTSERTARTQSTVIYSKAGLSNRSQLSAYFLEDLLVPTSL